MNNHDNPFIKRHFWISDCSERKMCWTNALDYFHALLHFIPFSLHTLITLQVNIACRPFSTKMSKLMKKLSLLSYAKEKLESHWTPRHFGMTVSSSMMVFYRTLNKLIHLSIFNQVSTASFTTKNQYHPYQYPSIIRKYV